MKRAFIILTVMAVLLAGYIFYPMAKFKPVSGVITLPQVKLAPLPGQQLDDKTTIVKVPHHLGKNIDTKVSFLGTPLPYHNTTTTSDDNVSTTQDITYEVDKDNIIVTYRSRYDGGYGRTMTIAPMKLDYNLSKPLHL